MAHSSAGLENYDAQLTIVGDPVREARRDREEHLRSRPCIREGCKGGFACRRHGTPVEGRAEWLFGAA